MPANDRSQDSVSASRRAFLKSTAAAVATSAVAPTILGATDKSSSAPPILGQDAHRYEAHHNWGELPDHIKWGETHGVTVDKAGMIYIKHRATTPEPMDAIVVFDPAGKFVRSFGKEYHGGGHGIDIREEGGEEFLYLCDVKNRLVAKTTLSGEHHLGVVLTRGRGDDEGVGVGDVLGGVPEVHLDAEVAQRGKERGAVVVAARDRQAALRHDPGDPGERSATDAGEVDTSELLGGEQFVGNGDAH